MIWALGSIWKVFQLVRANFEQFGAGPVKGRSNRPPSGQMFGMRSNRPGQSEQVFALCCIAMLHCCNGSGECALAQGELAYVQGELFVLFELWIGGLRSLLEHGFVSDVSSRFLCVRGPRLVFFK
jgi:hypothetical protein